jgi:hypothetical protein
MSLSRHKRRVRPARSFEANLLYGVKEVSSDGQLGGD